MAKRQIKIVVERQDDGKTAVVTRGGKIVYEIEFSPFGCPWFKQPQASLDPARARDHSEILWRIVDQFSSLTQAQYLTAYADRYTMRFNSPQ